MTNVDQALLLAEGTFTLEGQCPVCAADLARGHAPDCVLDAALADDPYPPEAFHRGRYHRLRVGRYRVMYVIDNDLITIERVDRVVGG